MFSSVLALSCCISPCLSTFQRPPPISPAWINTAAEPTGSSLLLLPVVFLRGLVQYFLLSFCLSLFHFSLGFSTGIVVFLAFPCCPADLSEFLMARLKASSLVGSRVLPGRLEVLSSETLGFFRWRKEFLRLQAGARSFSYKRDDGDYLRFRAFFPGDAFPGAVEGGSARGWGKDGMAGRAECGSPSEPPLCPQEPQTTTPASLPSSTHPGYSKGVFFFLCIPPRIFLPREKLLLKPSPALQLSGASRCIALMAASLSIKHDAQPPPRNISWDATALQEPGSVL